MLVGNILLFESFLLYPTIIRFVASSYSHRINGRYPSLAGLDLLSPTYLAVLHQSLVGCAPDRRL